MVFIGFFSRRRLPEQVLDRGVGCNDEIHGFLDLWGGTVLWCARNTTPTISLPLYHRPSAQYLLFLVSFFFPTKNRPRKERAEQGLVGETPQKNKEQFFTLFFIMMTDECRLQ